MTYFTALLAIVIIALLLVQLGANALALTGMSQAAARFQAASAFFGVGYTTVEAEMVVNHPVRRRIILHLIIAGNIGITSGLATLILTLLKSNPSGYVEVLMLVLLVGGAIAFGLLLNVRWVKKPLDRVMKRFLKSAGVVKALDYDVLLNIREGFAVTEVEILEGHLSAGKTLRESHPSDLGIIVLGIQTRDGSFIGAPDKEARLEVGDVAMVYGSEEAIAKYSEIGCSE